MLERPTITAWAPRVSMPERISICWTPYGVAGRKAVRSPITSLPTFTGWKPSTSLAGSIRRSTRSELMCFGSGSCTRMPWISRSALSRSTVSSSSASLAEAGNRKVTECIPAFGPAPQAWPPRPRLQSGCSARWLFRRAPWRSPGEIHRPGLPDHHHFDLARILQLALDFPGNRIGELRGSTVVDPIGGDHHPDLTARLNYVALLHSGEPVGDLLQTGQPFDVALEGFPPSTGARAADGVGCLHQDRLSRFMGHIVV